ncbi:N-terminal acetyltransferase B complex auxiliary subunit NAA25-like isoform X2 [Impatiens glandulifera]|uniref:N-terminal acetyltransferase B complex auxiliary subunit NAA25-like isoform X2 n=1 Tax=Impatiens glandulifera TaxID=253017 RepID=UPI001FB04DAA|nr:N-terminal acetyltransferase B complex auxiliary subunit NAA25-like isoform X2 [Impatiens glandulifera]
MASKFGLPGGIPERRVRPIWDAIDSRQFKNALKLSTSLLSKHPNTPYALALKALILERMGKSEEALSICLNAKELLHANTSVLIDDLTLSTLQIVFQRLDHLDKATSCYEFACTKFPNNLELMMGLFNCYVREYSFVKQQQIAIKMYKIVGEERFLLWAVCSIQLQVLCGKGDGKLLLLAEGLLKKHITSHSLHEPEALTVYISLLEQQSKFKDALEVLCGNLGSLIMIEVDRLRVKGRVLARAGDYAAAVDVFQKILELCPDDWECFLDYLGCLLEDGSCWSNVPISDLRYPRKYLDSNFSHLTEESFDSRISTATVLVQKLLEEANEGSIRGPRLALIEIERRKSLFGKENDDKLIETIMEYFLRFGHLASCTSDVEPFVQMLSPGKKAEFVKTLTENMEPIVAVPKEVLGRSITVFKIQELVGSFFNLPTDDLELLALQMVELYYKNLPLSKELDPQENMPGEELLTLVSNILVQLFWRTKNFGYLVEATMILEFGLSVRRFVWQYKIMLLHLYSHWGVLPLAYQWYKSLDVKNILLETVSHHILPQMLLSPLWIDLNDLLSNYLKFMDDHFRESADLTFLAYRHRNYSKVIEFIQFKERLQGSSQYLSAKIEALILQLKQHSDNVEEEERILENLKFGIDFLELSNEIGSKTLTFNEDLQSRPWWTPTFDKNYLLGPFQGVSHCPKENMHQINQAQVNMQKTLEKRSLLPRMIYLSIRCASSSIKENIEANGSIVDTRTPSELKALLDRYTKFLGFHFQDAIELVVEVSSGKKPLEALRSDLIDWVNFAVLMNAWNLNSNESRQDIWSMVNSLIEKYIVDEISSLGSVISSPGSNLPTLIQLVTEPLAWHSLIIQACVRTSFPSGKKKKKVVGPSEQSNNNANFSQGIRDSIESLTRSIEKVAEWLREEIGKPEDENVEVIVSSIDTKDQNGGPGKVLKVLETNISLMMGDVDLGDQISGALKLWNHVEVARRIVNGHHTVLSEFLRICELKVQTLRALKSQL